MTVAKAYLTGSVNRGQDLQRLEAELLRYTGVNHAVTVSQCRYALHLLVKHLVKPGQKVILSPYTIHDVINMVIAAGAIPVFADIDKETCNISLEDARSLIDENTGAILITHFQGMACDAMAFRRLCDEHGIKLIEDCAQAFGAMTGNRLVGTVGHAGAYSFNRVKNVNSFYGGAIVTDDAELAARIRQEVGLLPPIQPRRLLKQIIYCAVRELLSVTPVFQLVTYPIVRFASLRGSRAANKVINTEEHPVRRDTLSEFLRCRMTQMQARIVIQQLDSVERSIERRSQIAEKYYQGLKNIRGLQLPPRRMDHSHIYLGYPIQVEDRDAFIRHMMRAGRDIAIQHCGNLADEKCFKSFHRDCPNARWVAQRVVLLPDHPKYSDREVQRTIAATRAYFETSENPLG
ncbi:MAG: DegT/DnrJ/EryC1/StrS family aminotransferase [Bradyrhizobiaceae bacterium]|nr:DegT/DnrJ/EryC1/StrS family aminotransferase [Bradyrhizobiaceae bacterium]